MFAKMKSALLSGGLLLLGCVLAASAAAGTVEPRLLSIIAASEPGDRIPVIVRLQEPVDLETLRDPHVERRRTAMIRALQERAAASRRPLAGFLASLGADVTPLWIINGFAVKVPAHVIEKLAAAPPVASIGFDGLLKKPVTATAATIEPEWNLTLVGAPDLWALGYNGTGTVVATMDTGVDGDHPDLGPKYRGGSNSWLDPHGEHPSPYDADGHGTQTMGILAGGAEGGTAIGMAPAAQWIAVKLFNDAGYSTYSTAHAGFQWLLDPDGDPATDDAPDVVNNSWGYLENADECITEFEEDVRVLKAAEIAVVFAAGNAGPTAGSSVSPANCADSFAVGAVDDTPMVADYSSRGPSACDGSLFPELVAPGSGIMSTDLTFGGIIPDSYASVTGTSFAAPHVAGGMALLRSAYPDLTVAELEGLLLQTAADLGPAGADNEAGHGLLDVAVAYSLAAGSTGDCPDQDGDGFFAGTGCTTLADCDDADAEVYPGAVEIKHDAVDQDCNGYDLTIDITSAVYSAKKDALSVEAVSALGRDAALELTGFGAMKWDRKNGMWKISVRRAGGNPGLVTVSGLEGQETSPVAAR